MVSSYTIAYIALGANVNNPRYQLQTALQHIEKIAQTTVLVASSLYETKPLGSQDQPDYINQVIAVETGLAAHELLLTLQDIEHQMGRVRTVRWGPRVIDCDILLYGDTVIDLPDLKIPHPEMKNRDFVLYP